VCGLTGFLEHRDRPPRREILQRMTDSLRHRGPDDEGSYLDDRLALGVRRLSIIDVQKGRQPIASEDGTVLAALNGEIYNYQTLRRTLESRGHRFRTATDTEVLVHAYEDGGEDCVSALDGMFAFAIWDAPRRALMLARDRMGEKPLYYYAGPDVFVFGSELRALLEHPAVPRELDLLSLSRYLAFEYVPAPHAILVGVAKLPPGHLLTVSPGSKPRVVPYWDLTFRPDDSVDEEEWAERLRTELARSVERRLVSDVPVGFFLSGGLDSSTVVAMAARLNGSRRVKTFTLGFAEPSFDERPFARVVAQQFGTEHEDLCFSGQDALGLVEEVGRLLDEPLVDGSFLPFYALSRAARRAVTVVLSGDGGDELFCGYPTFVAERGVRWFEHLPRWVRDGAAALVRRLPSSNAYGSVDFLLKQFFRGLPYPPEIRTQLLLGGITPAEQSRLLAPSARVSGAGFDPYGDLPSVLLGAPPELSALDRLIYQHCKFYLADHNLVTVDRASMAASLEVRSPFLDPALVALAGRIPAPLKVRGWTTKAILKRALRPLLPGSIVGRRKQGFGVPIGPWLRGPLRSTLEERLAPERVARVGLFDPTATDRLVAEHLGGRHDHRKVLWALLMFDAWREHYLPHARWT
jgi:asparagine synthase (glutamine-hydrolysing)